MVAAVLCTLPQDMLWIGCDKLWSMVPHTLRRTKQEEAKHYFGIFVHIQIELLYRLFYLCFNLLDIFLMMPVYSTFCIVMYTGIPLQLTAVDPVHLAGCYY